MFRHVIIDISNNYYNISMVGAGSVYTLKKIGGK